MKAGRGALLFCTRGGTVLANGQCGEDTGEVSPPIGGGGPGKFSYKPQ